MKIIKWLVVIVIVLVLLVGGVIALVVSQIDSVAKTAIENGGTYAMGVETTVDSVDVGLSKGTFDLAGLKIANPAGFKEARFLTLDAGGVAVDAQSLRQPVIDLPTLALSGLTVNLEKSGGSANYTKILDNLKKLTSGSPAGSSSPQNKFIVREVDISKVVVNADVLGLGPVSPRISIPIHEIKLSNVGKGQGGVGDTGVTFEQLASIIVQAVLRSAVDTGGLPAEMLGDLQGQLAQLGDLADVGVEMVEKLGDTAKQLTDAVEDVTNQIDDIGKKGKEAVDEVTKGLENLIPKKK